MLYKQVFVRSPKSSNIWRGFNGTGDRLRPRAVGIGVHVEHNKPNLAAVGAHLPYCSEVLSHPAAVRDHQTLPVYLYKKNLL